MDPENNKRKLKRIEVADPPLVKKKRINIPISSSSLPDIDEQEAMKKQKEVALFLAGKVISTIAKNSNMVFSPASINLALTMAAVTFDSKTLRSSILSFLRSSSIDELIAGYRKIASDVLVDGSKRGGPNIASVKGVWMEKSLPVNTSFNHLFELFFRATFAEVNFLSNAEEVRMKVNAWALRRTNGLIKDLFPPQSVTSETTRIYGNALYFKGSWEDKFDKSMTEHKPFHLLSGTSVSVPFMRSSGDQYIEAYDGFKVLRLPYRQGYDNTNRSFSMYFYLPDKKGEFDHLLETMTATPSFLDSHIPRERVKVGEFRIPKFKIEFGFEAANVFSDLELKVSMHQKALIEIDEEGTEAAAATVLMHFGGSIRLPKRIDFVADHPFLFLIREDKTGTVLLAGQIFDPSISSSSA